MLILAARWLLNLDILYYIKDEFLNSFLNEKIFYFITYHFVTFQNNYFFLLLWM